MNSDGNVGIGTTDPAFYKLQVAGTIYGESEIGVGVHGKSYSGYGVYGDGSGHGVGGHSYSGYGVHGISESGDGVRGESNTGTGVYGKHITRDNYGYLGGAGSGVYGCGSNYDGGVYGTSPSGDGVAGMSTSGNGVYGWSATGYAGRFDGKGYFGQEVNIDTSGVPALRVNGSEAIWFDGTEFSWGFGGIWNYFSDAVCIGGPPANPTPHKLRVNGTAYKTQGGGSWASPSDARLKNIHGEYQAGLCEVCQLTPVRYSYKQDNDQGLSADGEGVGVVAQEVQTVIPEAVQENSDGYLMVNNDPIIWAMLNAIKELKTENKSLKQRLEALESRINQDQPARLTEVQNGTR